MQIRFLNLDRSADRLASFLQTNAHLKDPIRVAAVDGASIARNDLHAAGLLAPDIQTYSNGAIGCALSHATQWDAIARGNEAVTIAEDDAIFHHDFEALALNVIHTLPDDWDIIQWGWNFDSILSFQIVPGVSRCVGIFDQDGLRANIETYQRTPLRPVAHRLERSLGTVCQTVSPGGARKLLQHCLPLRKMEAFYPLLNRMLPNTGIDNMMNELYPRIQAYVSMPPLVVTRNEHQLSTIQQRTA